VRRSWRQFGARSRFGALSGAFFEFNMPQFCCLAWPLSRVWMRHQSLEAEMLFMTELVGVPKITLGGGTDEEIIGNLMLYIGFGFVILAGLYVLMRVYLPGALERKTAKAAAKAERQKMLNS
jgi:hypothetical protein